MRIMSVMFCRGIKLTTNSYLMLIAVGSIVSSCFLFKKLNEKCLREDLCPEAEARLLRRRVSDLKVYKLVITNLT